MPSKVSPVDSMPVETQISHSRSPSPAAPAPVADAPGPRAQALCNAFEKALDNTLRRCNYDNFAACFPTPAQYRGETLDQFWREFVGRLEGFSKENFEQLLSDRAVVPSLNELHRLIEDAKARKQVAETEAQERGKAVEVPAAPHTLAPSTLVESHLAPFLDVQQNALSTKLQDLHQANTGIMQDIEAQRAEMRHLLASLEDVVVDLEKSADMMRQDDVQGLLGEVRSVEMELRG